MPLYHRDCMVLCPEKCAEILKFSCPTKNLLCPDLDVLLAIADFEG